MLAHALRATIEFNEAEEARFEDSHRAIQVNLEIMRTFVRLRAHLASHAEMRVKLAQLESKYDHQFKIVFDAIRQMMAPPKSESMHLLCSAAEAGRRGERDDQPLRTQHPAADCVGHLARIT